MRELADLNSELLGDEPSLRSLVASLCQQLVVVGADLAELFERLTRRYRLTLVQYNMLNLLARLHPEPQEPWRLAQQVLATGSNHITMVLTGWRSRRSSPAARTPTTGADASSA